MNKELIKTYFEEFKHWLSGGNVQVYYKKDDEPKWLTDKECIEYEGHDNFSHIMQNSLEPEDVLIIIDDEYIEFRRALAEGKIVEVATDYNDVDGYIWKSMEDKEFHHFNVDEIRIKPEEPKFKVGDWVVNKKSKQRIIKKVTSVYSDSDTVTVGDSKVGINVMLIKDLEIWQPVIGEWCVMYDTEEDPDADSITLQKWDGKGKWTPIPFIGQLPPYIKDSDES